MSLRSRTKSIKDPTRITTNESDGQDPTPPTVIPSPSPSLPQRAVTQTLASTAHLANLLPTGTLLAFQLLTPIFSNNGACDSVTRFMTQLLLLLLAASCFLASFTDSFRSSDGQLYYGFATPGGMWLFDYPITDSSFPDLSKYKLRFIDCVHGGLSVLVFIAIALRDKNVLNCLYPQPEKETQEVLDIVPIGIGLICSLMFVVFPTRRHGIGYPVTLGK
ncbi:protein DMP3-like [Magnolia sinica]|uniref:protein DMP3-like n=1 Tax=Magnolia sinica TaxID=86752 RepID=UPI002658BAB1|nr:protein DMP3-like [Magnolia sinica]